MNTLQINLLQSIPYGPHLTLLRTTNPVFESHFHLLWRMVKGSGGGAHPSLSQPYHFQGMTHIPHPAHSSDPQILIKLSFSTRNPGEEGQIQLSLRLSIQEAITNSCSRELVSAGSYAENKSTTQLSSWQPGTLVLKGKRVRASQLPPSG